MNQQNYGCFACEQKIDYSPISYDGGLLDAWDVLDESAKINILGTLASVGVSAILLWLIFKKR